MAQAIRNNRFGSPLLVAALLAWAGTNVAGGSEWPKCAQQRQQQPACYLSLVFSLCSLGQCRYPREDAPESARTAYHFSRARTLADIKLYTEEYMQQICQHAVSVMHSALYTANFHGHAYSGTTIPMADQFTHEYTVQRYITQQLQHMRTRVIAEISRSELIEPCIHELQLALDEALQAYAEPLPAFPLFSESCCALPIVTGAAWTRAQFSLGKALYKVLGILDMAQHNAHYLPLVIDTLPLVEMLKNTSQSHVILSPTYLNEHAAHLVERIVNVGRNAARRRRDTCPALIATDIAGQQVAEEWLEEGMLSDQEQHPGVVAQLLKEEIDCLQADAKVAAQAAKEIGTQVEELDSLRALALNRTSAMERKQELLVRGAPIVSPVTHEQVRDAWTNYAESAMRLMPLAQEMTREILTIVARTAERVAYIGALAEAANQPQPKTDDESSDE